MGPKPRMEAVWRWLAWHLPKGLVTQCGIRIWVHATTGKWSNEVIPEVPSGVMFDRWEHQ